MKVGLLGGSFDPIHQGHIKLARAALTQLKLAKVIFVLSPRSPFKLKKKMQPANVRLCLMKGALHSEGKMSIGLWELKRKGPSYTVSTLSSYKKKHPSHDVYWILGSDAYRSFPKWKNPKKISEMTTLVVGRRPGSGRVSVHKKYKDATHVLKGVFPDFSSTSIRIRLSDQKSVRAMIPSRTLKKIKMKGIYGVR